ncbi:uncharacterized protein PV09_08067 [Verruconis gallopava]|uniref:L-ornithine N(5)-monooxygenase [NAD(P)H] n=1 Tax=Verruconis gallopava TaxID=253628 RepID=A0A0D2A1Z5_9PEZI|nr:uncharacterized protein PV09_08067 [Verruconis gallopava]KIW00355.1 hypothetical protein PV09_08067 [Verruconis gallopava]
MECSAGVGYDAVVEREKCYEVVIIGFGPAGLAQAIALYEQEAAPKDVLILEKSTGFRWRGNEFPDGRAKMRTNMVHDLVTARNPKSEFTFVNYLWTTDKLVGYTNLGLINPPRRLFGMYLEWCAEKFEKMNWVQYGREAMSVEPNFPEASSTDRFRIRVRDIVSKNVDSVIARKVIVAPGVLKQIPAILRQPGLEDRVAHSSDLRLVEPKILQRAEDRLKIAIIGGSNDEAAEVLQHCMSWERPAEIALFTDGDVFQQADKNPFARNTLLASETKTFETLSRGYGHVKPESTMQSDILSSLYLRNYAQDIRNPTKEQSEFTVAQCRKLVRASRQDESGKLTLFFENVLDHTVSSHGPFDFVFAASGYSRGLHERLVAPLKEYFDDRKGGLSVNADYRVNLDRRFVDRRAGIWMIDGFEGGTSDAFSFMALRADRILKSIMSADKSAENAAENGLGREQVQRPAL